MVLEPLLVKLGASRKCGESCSHTILVLQAGFREPHLVRLCRVVVLLCYGEPSTTQSLPSTSIGNYCCSICNTLYWTWDRIWGAAERQQGE